MNKQIKDKILVVISIISLLLFLSPLIIFLIKVWKYMLRDALAWSM